MAVNYIPLAYKAYKFVSQISGEDLYAAAVILSKKESMVVHVKYNVLATTLTTVGSGIGAVMLPGIGLPIGAAAGALLSYTMSGLGEVKSVYSILINDLTPKEQEDFKRHLSAAFAKVEWGYDCKSLQNLLETPKACSYIENSTNDYLKNSRKNARSEDTSLKKSNIYAEKKKTVTDVDLENQSILDVVGQLINLIQSAAKDHLTDLGIALTSGNTKEIVDITLSFLKTLTIEILRDPTCRQLVRALIQKVTAQDPQREKDLVDMLERIANEKPVHLPVSSTPSASGGRSSAKNNLRNQEGYGSLTSLTDSSEYVSSAPSRKNQQRNLLKH